MREHQKPVTGFCGPVQKSSHRGFSRSFVNERFCVGAGHKKFRC